MDQWNSHTPLLEMNNLALEAGFKDSSSGYESTGISDVDSLTSGSSWNSRDDLDSISSCSSRSAHSCHDNTRSLSTYLSSDDDLGSVSVLSSSRDDLTDSDAEQAEPEMMNFSSQQALCESLKYIMSMPDLCDVTFLVGANQVPVHGVRAILGTRSRVFYNLLLQHQKEADILLSLKTPKTPKVLKTPRSPFKIPRTPIKTPPKPSVPAHKSAQRLIIPVRKYDPEVFHRIVQFVHCGKVTMDTETAPGILCGAVQFGLRDLEKACWGFINRCILQGHTDALVRPTRGYSQHKIANKLLSKICTGSTDRLVASFPNLSIESPV